MLPGNEIIESDENIDGIVRIDIKNLQVPEVKIEEGETNIED